MLTALPLRLIPGQDLRIALTDFFAKHQTTAGFVLQGIGSLSVARLRYAGSSTLTELQGDLEILTLAGTLSGDGAHLHMSVADSAGNVIGGHVGTGCLIRTTAEILIAVLPAHHFGREPDQQTGFDELVIRDAGAT